MDGSQMGTECGKDSKLGQVVLEFDSLALVAKLQSGNSGRALVDHIHDDIKSLALKFVSLFCCHVKRVGNTVTHYLARIIPDMNDEQIFCENFSNCIYILADLDLQY